jgi:dephospho-CoA kinase
VVSSDEIVHHLIRADPEVRSAMIERLGDRILGENGEIDRSRVAERVFGDREALAWLEGLLHPKVSAEYLRWREQLAELPNPPAVTVTEVPLLYEVGAQDRFDKVVVITAPDKLREARARVPLAGRSDRLLPDGEKVERADFAYVNAGSLEDLDAFVAVVMGELGAGREPART